MNRQTHPAYMKDIYSNKWIGYLEQFGMALHSG
jgi:hypothetical protein